MRHLIGAATLAVLLWMYGERQAWPPVRAAWQGGGSRYMLQPLGLPYGGYLTGNDFRHIYIGTRALWQRKNPYDPRILLPMGEEITGSLPLPYVYPPFTALALGPLALYSYTDAFLIWFVAGHLLVFASLTFSFRALGMKAAWPNVAFALCLVAASGPLYRTLSAGQLNLPLAAAYPLFWLLLRRRQACAAGLVGAAAAWFKLSPGALMLYLLWTRRWRAAAWMAVWGAMLLCLSLALFGVRPHLEFLPMLRDMGYGRSTWSDLGHHFYCDATNQSFNSLFHHLFSDCPIGTTPWIDLGPGWANGFTWAATIIVAGISFWLTRTPKRLSEFPLHHGLSSLGSPSPSSAPSSFIRLREGAPPHKDPPRNDGGGEDPLGLSLFVLLSLFAPSLCWDHYFVQLLFPMLAVYAALQKRPSIPIAVLFVVALAMLLPIFLYWPGVSFGNLPYRSGPGLLLMSWKLWGAIALFVSVCCLIRGGRRETFGERA